MRSSHPILVTKISVPSFRTRLVRRPRLTQRLNAGLAGKLTIISAPPGFGKTTLLGEWRALLPAAYALCWVALGTEDNDPLRFWTYVVAALQSTAAGLGDGMLELLHSPQPPPPESALPLLINDVATSSGDFVLVLDDYHLIEQPDIHRAVGFLLQHLPPQLHLVIASRTDPPLPAARLRARGQLTELTAQDLRFTSEEATAFLTESMALPLQQAAVTTLEARTEGWVAGLQLAALALQNQQDPAAYVPDFTGRHRYVIDYLAEEVLDRQMKAVQTFLLETSILPALCADLCDAVTERRGSQMMLEGLEEAHLFVVPLDGERRWYRYHHLFADFLRSRLRERLPEREVLLRRRAQAWYEAQGLIREAVEQTLAAGDFDAAAELLLSEAQNLLVQGDVGTLINWLGSLPESLLLDYPRLGLVYAWSNVHALRFETTQLWLERVQALLSERPEPSPALWGRWYAVRAYARRLWKGEFRESVEDAHEALRRLPPEETYWRSVAKLNLGFAHITGALNLKVAADLFEEVASPPDALAHPYGTLIALIFLGWTRNAVGRLHDAERAYERALACVEKLQASHWPIVAYIDYGLAELAWQWGRPTEALTRLDRALTLSEQAGNLEVRLNSLILLVKIYAGLDESAKQEESLERLRRVSAQFELHQIEEQITLLEVNLALDRGDLAPARRWMEQNALVPPEQDALYAARAARYTTLLRAAIALGRAAESLPLISDMERALDGSGARRTRLRLRQLRALALHAVGREEAALDAIEAFLKQVAPEGGHQVLVHRSPAMAHLLRAAAARGVESDYVQLLLAHFDAEPVSEEAVPPNVETSPPASLAEPLTEREEEVLRYLPSGLSTPEIAETLFVAPSTVRSHIKSIYGKLGVHSRVEAIERARALGLL